MDVIVSHDVADFDAHHLDVDEAAVRHLVIVDVRSASRLRDFPRRLARAQAGDPSLRVTVWDHHRAQDDDVPATELITARAREDVDVGAVLRELGGGGHAGAASCLRRDIGADALHDALLAALERVPGTVRVRQVMTTCVRATDATASLADVDATLVATRCSGLPVLAGSRLVGIVSRSDVERARRDGRLAHPAGSCMRTKVATTSPDASMREALATLERAGVGGLPVLCDGRVVGIVTRTDLRSRLFAGGADS